MWKDSETELDFLDYGYMVNLLKDIICTDSLLPASIGLYGDWGSGKSSLMHMCIRELENIKDEKIKCLIFNGWLFESYSDAKTALLNSILDAIEKEKGLGDTAKAIIKGLYRSVDKFSIAQKAIKYGIDFITTGGIGTLANLTCNTILTSLQEKTPSDLLYTGSEFNFSKLKQSVKDELDDKELREDIREFQEQFAQLIEESKISRLVIFIDELDRCREDTILDTLEAMKLFMFSGKVAFVIGADERHISYAVKSKFKDIEGIQIDIGKEYLEKLVQYPIHIPRMDINETEVYIASLLLSAEISQETFDKYQTAILTSRKEHLLDAPLKAINSSIAKNDEETEKMNECVSIARQLAAVLSNGLHGNPRQVKRFLNTLDMRMKMAKYKNVILDRRVLAKLMLLEYIRSAAFNRFAEMAANDELQTELEILEEGVKETVTEDFKLQSWLKDEWLKDWVGSEPKLAKEELNKYFFFARTSLDEKISRISVNLSPEAQAVLDGLLSKSDIKIGDALQKDVSDAEADMIMEAMIIRMGKEGTIDKKQIKAFVCFALKKDTRYVTAAEYIKSLPATSLSGPCMVYIADFARETGFLQEIQETVRTWGKTSANLEQLFNNALKNGDE